MVVNPTAAKRFAQALMTRSKSDAVDAGVLAQFAQSMPFQPWQRPATPVLEVRACARRLAALVKARTQAKNQLHAASQTISTPEIVLADLRRSIAQCDDHIEQLRAGAGALIEADAQLREVFTRLNSVKGIAAASAIQIMGEILVLPADMQAKQWLAQAGRDPRHATSGTSVNTKPHLSKAGNRYLRVALYMPALSAARHEKHVNGYYRHRIEDRGEADPGRRRGDAQAPARHPRHAQGPPAVRWQPFLCPRRDPGVTAGRARVTPHEDKKIC